MHVLDVAIGTAAVARGAARIVGPEGRVFGVDPSIGMLGQARRVFHGPLTRGVAESLPFASNHFDFVTMGIALRHVSDLVATFREYLRVLRPGGKLWILEGHVPRSALGHKLTRFVWARVIPGMTLLSTRSREAKELMDYYWDTVEQCVPPETILQAMREAGFEAPRFQVVVPGAFCEYTGSRRRSWIPVRLSRSIGVAREALPPGSGTVHALVIVSMISALAARVEGWRPRSKSQRASAGAAMEAVAACASADADGRIAISGGAGS
jgi:demethylmenaquinone methyltransferase/2-methoxy-6-polyprenyl-1,4-benzoquinol methylase